MAEADDTKPCPLCGEPIKRVALRCKHCQADLTKLPGADFDRGTAPLPPKPADDFEMRFLEFAYQTNATLNVPAVAHALKLPTAQVAERLEELAARDVIGRDTDDQGNLFFTIPGRRATLRSPAYPPLQMNHPAGPLAHISAGADGKAVTALVLNVVVPGLGSLVSGHTSTGVAQMGLWLIGFVFTMTIIGALLGLPLIVAAWAWSVVSGVRILEESKQRQIQN